MYPPANTVFFSLNFMFINYSQAKKVPNIINFSQNAFLKDITTYQPVFQAASLFKMIPDYNKIPS